MRNEDNACIRYLMREMDPSEEVLMERAMMEDEDLLIEVECMRQTLKRLDDLPQFDPPGDVTESIVEKAAAHSQGAGSYWHSGPFLKAVAAAAVVVFGLLFGGSYWLMQGTGVETGSSQDRETSRQSAAAPSASSSMMNIISSDSDIEPWIDRNNVIHFQDRFNDNKIEFDSILKTSTQKLTPLTDPNPYTGGSRTLQLTGGGE